MRLVGGLINNEGQMELCINGVWGAVCLYPWNSFAAKLICKQLGYQDYGNVLLHSVVMNIYYVFLEPTTPKRSKLSLDSIIHVHGAFCDAQHSTLLSCLY